MPPPHPLSPNVVAALPRCGLLFNFLFSARPYACSMERMTCRIAADERVAVQSGSQKFSEDTSSMAGAFDSALYRANDLRR